MSLEWDIHHQLTAPQDAMDPPVIQAVASTLIQRWKEQGLTLTDKMSVASFLINSGYEQEFLNLIIDTLGRDEEIPWAHLAEACRDLQMPESVLNSMLEGAESQGLLDSFLRAPSLSNVSDRIEEARRTWQEAQSGQRESQRQQLLDKLQYLQSQRMFDEEGRALREFSQMFPNDPAYARLAQAYDERWAREIVAQKAAEANRSSTHTRVEVKSPEELQIERTVVNAVHEAVRESAQAAYDLAILLYFLDLFKPAQTVLAHTTSPTLATDWFGLELLLKARQFVEALEEATRLETKYAQDPETTFAVTYARARALQGLGQTESAIELIQSILQLRPNYRSAQLLLDDWSGGQL